MYPSPRQGVVVNTSTKNDDPARDPEVDPLLARLAQRVRLLRAQRGMTRKQLAAQSGVSIPYLARVEGGEGNVSLALLHKLAKALGVPTDALLSDGEPQSGDLTIILEFLRQQPPHILARIRRQLMLPTDTAESRTRDRIALIGLRGAGKSTLGPMLAARLGVPFIELNKEIERQAGIGVGEVITIYGQTAMRQLERESLERVIADHSRVVIATGGGIVAESGTYEQVLRSFYTVWLNTRPDVLFERVLREKDARIATPALHREALEHIHRMLEARTSLYRLADAVLDTSDMSLDGALNALASLVLAESVAA